MNAEKKAKSGPLILLIIDGWGIAPPTRGNALAAALMPNFKALLSKYPAASLAVPAASLAVPAASAAAGKKINLSSNYAVLGVGRLKAGKDDISLFDVFKRQGINYLSIAEAEKFAYAAYFFSGKKKLPKDNFLLARSGMADDYALAPELATPKIAEELVRKIKSRAYGFIVAVLANLDLTAHTGNFDAAVKAAEIADSALKIITKAALDSKGVLIISSASGNAEEMAEKKTELPNKKDSVNPVPFVVIGRQFEGKTLGFKEAPGGDLALVAPVGTILDIAPTILKIMNLEIPEAMEGKPLF
jgi:bisphosphoglycerate-independent phosphoglycerate mutase (AlkP superfamily)